MNNLIPFNKPYMTGKELLYIADAHASFKLAGDGPFTQRCHEWLEKSIGCNKALLTHSCTAALEISALLINIQPGDEVIMPSYTFVSTANAFVLRGGVPVFVDIRDDTLNLDEQKIEIAITSRTKAIVPVHYAGVACEMDIIMDIAEKHNLIVIEDAAQGVMSTYKGKPLGSIGHIGCFSFHETKNIISGEGGAILINDPEFTERAEIVREKGTNRSKFFRGHVDKYTWVDIGSSYLPGEITAAFLWAQMEEAENITRRRLEIWNHYHDGFKKLENLGKLRRPAIPSVCSHNGHMYYILCKNMTERNSLIKYLAKKSINAVFHYIPLHTSLAGKKYGVFSGDDEISTKMSERMLRLPLFHDITSDELDFVIDAVGQYYLDTT